MFLFKFFLISIKVFINQLYFAINFQSCLTLTEVKLKFYDHYKLKR